MNKKKTWIISLAILLSGGVITTLIFTSEPTAKREGATRETAMLVEVVEVSRGSWTPVIVATGTVEPAREIILSPRVNGEVTGLPGEFTPGGYVRKGQVLLQIDPSDYINRLKLRKSDLEQARAELLLEEGRQEVARQDYALLSDSVSGENKALILREPQLRSVQARVDAAEAAVEQAALDVERTTLRAPFNAHIISRNTNIGSQVAVGENLGRLVGYDEYWIIVSVPVSKVPWLEFPESGRETGAPVMIRNRTAWPEDLYREGSLLKLIGALESQTRLARVLVTVPDPLLHNDPGHDKPRLMIGSFVEVRIQAREIPDIIRLSRDHIRKDQTVWVMKEGKLQIRKPEIVFMDADYAYIGDGLEDGEKVVTTNLSTVVEGAGLRVAAQNTGLSGAGAKDSATVDPLN